MEKKPLYRISMLVVGLLAASVILLSQSYYKEGESVKPKQEQSDSQQQESQTFVSAPSDLLPASGSVQIVETTPFQFSELNAFEPVKNHFLSVPKIFSSFFKTLFRTIISSNAP